VDRFHIFTRTYSSHMKRLILTITILIIAESFSFAQIKAPAQVDTLIVDAVKYNHDTVKKEYWPCTEIYKGMDTIKIGGQAFKVTGIKRYSTEQETTFCLKDQSTSKEEEMVYMRSSTGEYTMSISGYDFYCHILSRNQATQDCSDKEITTRAIFHSVDNTSSVDESAIQATRRVSSEPNAKLKGRQILGAIPSPSYSVDNNGTIVVDIWVDQYGNVTKATVGEGTTLTDKALWSAAVKAAKESHFTMKADAPTLQQGTITYKFESK